MLLLAIYIKTGQAMPAVIFWLLFSSPVGCLRLLIRTGNPQQRRCLWRSQNCLSRLGCFLRLSEIKLHVAVVFPPFFKTTMITGVTSSENAAEIFQLKRLFILDSIIHICSFPCVVLISRSFWLVLLYATRLALTSPWLKYIKINWRTREPEEDWQKKKKKERNPRAVLFSNNLIYLAKLLKAASSWNVLVNHLLFHLFKAFLCHLVLKDHICFILLSWLYPSWQFFCLSIRNALGKGGTGY